MNAMLNEWLVFLRGADVMVTMPFLLGGGALMLFGWRIWKFCVVLCFVAIGALVGRQLAGTSGDHLLFAIVGAISIGALSYKLAKYAASLLGGLIGTGLVMEVLQTLGLTGSAYWLAALASLLSFSALAYINRQTVVVFVAAFLGAFLVVSGLAVSLLLSHAMYGYFNTMVLENGFVLPFAILVPTVMSCFYQISELNRQGAEA